MSSKGPAPCVIRVEDRTRRFGGKVALTTADGGTVSRRGKGRTPARRTEMIAAELRGGNKSSLNEALGWIGSRVDDVYGANVGRLEDVWIDPSNGIPRWLLIKEGRFGGRTTLIPFEDATAGAGHVWVPYERDVVRNAPEVEPGAPLTQQVEGMLRGHYAANASPPPRPAGGEAAGDPQGRDDAGFGEAGPPREQQTERPIDGAGAAEGRPEESATTIRIQAAPPPAATTDSERQGQPSQFQSPSGNVQPPQRPTEQPSSQQSALRPDPLRPAPPISAEQSAADRFRDQPAMRRPQFSYPPRDPSAGLGASIPDGGEPLPGAERTARPVDPDAAPRPDWPPREQEPPAWRPAPFEQPPASYEQPPVPRQQQPAPPPQQPREQWPPTQHGSGYEEAGRQPMADPYSYGRQEYGGSPHGQEQPQPQPQPQYGYVQPQPQYDRPPQPQAPARSAPPPNPLESLAAIAASPQVHYVEIELVGQLSIKGDLRSVRVVPRGPGG